MRRRASIIALVGVLAAAGVVSAASGVLQTDSRPEHPSRLAWYQLEVGDCTTIKELEDHRWYRVVPCDSAHRAEVLHVEDLGDTYGSVYPGELAAREFMTEVCDVRFGLGLGLGAAWRKDRANLAYFPVYPVKEEWDGGGSPIGLCFLVDRKDRALHRTYVVG